MTHSPASARPRPGEFDIISRISARVGVADGVVTGIGDDAAVTALSPGMQLLTSTDMLLEDVHFRLSWHAPGLLGRKCLAVSVSDIAAMGGVPRWALLSLAIPHGLSLDFVDEFISGFLALASEYHIVLIGGDTCASRSGLVVSVTIMGEQFPGRIVRRSGAKPDDDIWVTGTLGDAARALTFVEGNRTGESEVLLARLLDPTPRVATALALTEAGLVSAMIDISDGVLADFGHIAELSGVGGRICLADLPLSNEFRTATDHAALPLHLALSGGEDYELCFTASRSNREKINRCVKKSGITATRIGIVTSFSGVEVINPDGSLYVARTNGFDHFS